MFKVNKILNNIDEKFVTGYKSWGEWAEIYVNPSMDEIREVSNESNSGKFRFIDDKNLKKVYIGDMHTIHVDIAKKVDLSDNYEDLFSAFGIYKRTSVAFDKFSMVIAEDTDKLIKIFEDIRDGEYDWLDRYRFEIHKLKERVKKQFDEGYLSSDMI